MNRTLRFALFGNVYQAKKSLAAQTLLQELERHHAELYIDRDFCDFLTHKLQLSVHPAGLIDEDFTADVAISMGGDGTFLEAASRVGNKGIPILGINTGRLGFLADVTTEEIADAIESLYHGDYTIEERSVLQVSYSEGSPQSTPYALNEVAILKHDNSSMISLRVYIDGEYLTTYQADGLILNTPTGSTGYALSVGGSIMDPKSKAWGLVPIAPHSLNVRPVTLCDNSIIELSVESRSHHFLVAIDGRSESCHEHIRLTLQRAPYNVRVLKRQGSSFFHTLRNKLLWGSDLRE